MNNIQRKLLTSSAWLFGIIAYISLSLELFLFQIADYNIYQVLNISLPDLLILLFILLVQYLSLKRATLHINTIWESTKQLKINKYSLIILALSGSGIYAFLPSQFPFWVFLVVLLNLCFFTIISNNWKVNPFYKIIVLLLFGAGLNISLIFWMHEEANEGKHLRYAHQLAESQDTIAESILYELAASGKNIPSNVDTNIFWEKQWLSSAYLTSNYSIDFPTSLPDSSVAYYQPTLTFDEESTPIYKIFFPEQYALSFKLNTDFRKSIYASQQPFKNLKDLDNFHFAVVNNSKITLSNSQVFTPYILDVELPPIGKGEKIELEGFDVLAYRHTNDIFVLIGEPLSEVQVWISNFSFFFSLLLIVVIVWEIISLFILKKNIFDFWQELPIQFRIQIVLITITCSLFFIIASTTFLFLKQNNSAVSYERQLYISETLRDEILEEEKQYNWSMQDFSINFLARLADRNQCDIDLYNPEGNLINSSFATAVNSPAPKTIKEDFIRQIEQNASLILIEEQEAKENEESYLRTYFGIFKNNELEGITSVSSFKSEIGTAPYISIVMVKLLNVYVLLLIIAWGGGLLLISLLTKPLELLANRLSNFKLGQENEKLNWKGEDAIGQLILEYNKMVDKVEVTTQELIRSEREGAWQIMAQQIAHEINNKLTPLRLNIQFLNRIVDGLDQKESASIQRIANGLVEKIDALSKVASQFKLFAKLDSPEVKPIELQPFIKHYLSEYNRLEAYQYKLDIELKNGHSPIINIDIRHLQEVLNNIIANAEDSLLERQEGIITMRLKDATNLVKIEVEDNGKGIDPAMIKNIFDPNFSVNSSQTGLALPICKRIIEFYQGEFSFETVQGEGTCFIISFPIEKD